MCPWLFILIGINIHIQTSLVNFSKMPAILSFLWFYHSPNKIGMVNLIRYLSHFSNPLNFSCQWCLPIDLDSSPQSLSSDLSVLEKLFFFGPGIFTESFLRWIRLCRFCKEDLLLFYSFFNSLFNDAFWASIFTSNDS